jgi:cellulose synthase/poly-beta-1,6-N-acetylglucosamine synthase-like glycosyltransferase
MTFSLITGILLTGYAFMIIAITIGWQRLKVFSIPNLLPEVKVGVIVAVRNEELNIEALLKSLSAQNYPLHLLEIIVVDDHSTDSTSRLVEEFIAKNKEQQNIRFIGLGLNDNSGKKAAIQKGIQASECELVVITDADCTAGSLWISAIASYYALHKPHIILGPVRMTDKGSLFGKLQSLEFMSLVSTAAGSCNGGFPLLANGANMAFTRLAYESCGGFSGNMQFPSGDDMFLMLSIKRKFGAKTIRFLRSENAFVNTPATIEFKEFIQQRLRWVSKSRGYTDPLLIMASVLVFLTNAWLVITALAAIFSQQFLEIFLLFYLIKMLIDLPLMISYSRFQRSISLTWLFPFMELLNAFYTLIVGIAGNIVKYEWKARLVANKRMERR